MKHFLLYCLTVSIWGTTWFAVKFQLGEVPPPVSIFYRFLIASTLLLTYCALNKMSFKFKLKDHCYLFLMGLFMFSVHYIFIYESNFYLVSGLVSLLFSLVSVMNILNCYLFFGIKPKCNVVVGALIGLVGITLFLHQEVVNISLHADTLLGVGLALVATILFSFGNIISKRNQTKALELVPSVAIAMGYGTLIMFTCALAMRLPFTLPNNPLYLASLLYLSIPGSLIAFLCYIYLIYEIGPERAGYATVLFPVIALTISFFIENFRGNLWDFLGIALILFGNFLITSNRKLYFSSNRT